MTIFISISRGLVARNILQNDFLKLIKKHFKKIIILSPAYNDKQFINEFNGQGVEFVELKESKVSNFEEIVARIFSFLIFNKNTKRLILYDTADNNRSRLKYIRQYGKYILLRMIFQPLTWLKFPRKFLLHFDYYFLQRKAVNEFRVLIKKYQPDLVFSASIMEYADAALLKAARKEGIKSAAMPKSWDNPSKGYFRARADKVAVWSPFVKKQMIKLQDYKKEDLEIVGVPQFDYYIDENRILSREKFCQKLGLDPAKKIILFGSEGKLMPADPEIVRIILNFIKRKELTDKCQILIRPHFAYNGDRDKFKDFFQEESVKVDDFNNPSKYFSDSWDYSQEQMNHFLNIIYHSDLVISTCSTLSLDAIALHKPAIVIKFDAGGKRPLFRSVARWYVCDYYSRILELGGVFKAESINGLKKGINLLLKKPRCFSCQENKIRDEFCYKIDGQSGKRLFSFIKKF